MIVKYLGHSCFEIITEKIKILTDPFYFSHAPGFKRVHEPRKAEEIYDYILISHEHFDHCDSQLIEDILSDRTHIITTPEASVKTGHPCITLNEGQKYKDDSIEVTAVHAEHPQSANPIGFLFEIPETIYFAGDTDFFAQVSRLPHPFLAFLPIGGTFTMNVEKAAEAASLLRPSHVIPMHYDTWDAIKADTGDFESRVKQNSIGTDVHIIKPGEKVELAATSS